MSAMFPFGKWKGRPYADVPEDYFRWCLTKLDGLQPDTRQAIHRELARRRGELPLEAVSPEPVAGVADLERKIAARADCPTTQRVLGAALAFVRTMEG
jgi:hypothetical protein